MQTPPFATRLLDLILPPLCLACNAPVGQLGGLCPTCWNAIHFIAEPRCASCGRPFGTAPSGDLLCAACLTEAPGFDAARSCFLYDEHSRGLILSFKHADRPGLARYFAPWMARAAPEFLAVADLLVPVPLHWRRLLHRRYNQAALLAQLLARASGKAYRPDLLRRRRHTPPQGMMGRKERAANVRSAFALGKASRDLRGSNILLVDDVLTSGATITACAELLRSAGAARVDVLTLARVINPE